MNCDELDITSVEHDPKDRKYEYYQPYVLFCKSKMKMKSN